MIRSILIVLVLAGCAFVPGQSQPLTIEQEVAIACRGYSGTLTAITPFKSRMTIGQVAFINAANNAVIPACNAAAGNVEDASTDVLIMIRDNLRRMVTLEQQIKGDTS